MYSRVVSDQAQERSCTDWGIQWPSDQGWTTAAVPSSSGSRTSTCLS